MNWKVSYVKASDNAQSAKTYTTIKEIEGSGLSMLSVQLPAVIPDNTHCYYSAVFNSFEYGYVRFDGIDTLTEVFINGEKVLTAESEFHAYEVSDAIKDGENEIVVYVHPKFGKKSLLRDIILMRRKKCSISGAKAELVAVDTENDTASIHVTANVKLRDDALHDFSHLTYRFTLRDEKKTTVAEGELFGNRIDFTMKLERAKFWWPKNFGKPVLCDTELAVMDGTRILDVFDSRFPLVSLEYSVGKFILNGKTLPLIGPFVNGIENPVKLAEKLSSMGCNLCILPKSSRFLDSEAKEPFYENGVWIHFTSSLPENLSSPEEIKEAIEGYRISGLYQPMFELRDSKELCFVIRKATQPLCLMINKKTNELVCVNDLPYGDNVTYTVKDLTSGNKIVLSGIKDVEKESVTVLDGFTAEKGKNYLISWSTNSGKIHSNHCFTDSDSVKGTDYIKLLSLCGFSDEA